MSIHDWPIRIGSMVVSVVVVVFLAFGVALAGGKTGSGHHFPLVLATNWGSNTISLVDVDAGQELAVIEVGLKPYDIKVEPTGRFAFVTNSGNSDISIVDIQAMLEADRIPVGTSPRDIILSKDAKRAVVANSGDNSISVVDIASKHKQELFRVTVGTIPYGVALANDDQLALNRST